MSLVSGVNDDHRADCAADDAADLQSEYLSDMWIEGCAPSSPYVAEHAELNASCFVYIFIDLKVRSLYAHGHNTSSWASKPLAH